jgi:hypothetical protein
MRGCSPADRAPRDARNGALQRRCSGIAAAAGGRPATPEVVQRCAGTKVPGWCVRASDHRRRRMGRPVHSPAARSSVRFVVRRDAAHRGLSGRRPRTFERTSIPTAVGRGRSRTRVTNRATMSDRPRAGNASGGTYRPSSSETTIASRDSGRRSFCCMRRNGGRPPPFPLEEAPRSGPCLPFQRSRALVCAPAGVGGNRETAASGRIRPHLRAGRHPPGHRGYTPGVPGPRRGGSDRGGPAIARSGRVVRPVRRPSDRQTNRRSGGDPREICNQIPSPWGRDLSIPGGIASAAAPTDDGVAGQGRQLPHLSSNRAPRARDRDGTRGTGDLQRAALSLGAVAARAATTAAGRAA